MTNEDSKDIYETWFKPLYQEYKNKTPNSKVEIYNLLLKHKSLINNLSQEEKADICGLILNESNLVISELGSKLENITQNLNEYVQRDSE